LDGSYGNISKGADLRAQYKWIPSKFHIDENDRVHIKSGIHNLPLVPKNKKTYQLIAGLFEKMLPMFRKINIVGNGPEDLQVVVKAQRYAFPPGTSYAGRWHTEGYFENIVAAGVYYCEVDEQLVGGNVKFRSPQGPDDFYDMKNSHEIEIREGTAIVFANAIPHRVRKTMNMTSTTLFKTFINFFIVDPKFPIIGTDTMIPLSQFEFLLNFVPSEIASKIYSFFINYRIHEWESLESAKEFRSIVRSEMSQIPSGWAHIMWGNSGDMFFIDDFSTSGRRESDDITLTHTQSF
jgi:hypothetical protein